MSHRVDFSLLQNIELPTTGAPFSLSTLQGKWTVIYFYPKDDTSGCTKEGCAFRDAFPRFVGLNAQIFGVSRDSISSHLRFREQQQFPFELISDQEERLCRAFDVIVEKTLFGRAGFGIQRSTFLLNPHGEVVHVWRNVKVDGHVAEVQSVLEQLSKDWQ